MLLLFCGAAAVPARAVPRTTILPRGAQDWREEDRSGPEVTWSVEVVQGPGTNPVWRFQFDAVRGNHGQHLELRLPLADLGIDPPTPEEAEYWAWSWYIANVETADELNLSLIDENGFPLRLATTHAIYHYQRDFFEAPVSYRTVGIKLEEAVQANREIEDVDVPPLGRIVAVAVTTQNPHAQEFWLGPISFGPAKEEPPSPRAVADERRPGRAAFVDVDGDGVVEVIAPWLEGQKLWRYDASSRTHVLEERSDALPRTGALSLLTAADLDGDGDADLVGLGSDLETLHVLTNRAYGFTDARSRVPRPMQTAIATAMALADDDGDGDLDLFLGYHLMSNWDPSLGRIFRLAGRGNGRFGPPESLPTTNYDLHRGTYFITVVDLDGDGRLDLVSAAGGMGVHAFPGLGEGRYGEGIRLVPFVYSGFFRDLSVADVNGDGRPDLYVSMLDDSGIEMQTGQNYLALNEGGFRFRECGVGTGTWGGETTEDACFAEINGRPGPELVVLERDRIDVYDVATWRKAGADPQRAVPVETVWREPTGAVVFFCTDLNRDGVVDVVLSGDEGPSVITLDGSGPVRVVSTAGLGPRGGGIGQSIQGSDWSLPIESNSRTGHASWLVARDEQVALPAGAAGFAAWLRWRAPHLWEHPWTALRNRAVQAVLALASIGVLGGLLVRARRAARRREEETWLRLLQSVGITSHARWRESFTNFGRILRHVAAAPGTGEPSQLEALRALLPREILGTLREGAAAAGELGLEGGRAALRAVKSLESLHESGSPDRDALRAAVGALDAALGLIQRAIAERFTCDAGAVLRSVIAFHENRGTRLPPVTLGSGHDGVARAFPLRADHLFACLDELLVNAAKKEPRPARIEVSAGPDGQHRAFLDVWDDGAPFAAESGRASRAGTRTGLRRIEDLLAPYKGSVTVEDAEQGGVRARLRVPRFDLDA